MLNILLLVLAAVSAPPALLRSDAPAIEVTTSIRPVTEDRYQLLVRPTPGRYRFEVLDRAETRVTIYRDGKVIHRQTSVVALQR